MIIVKTPFRLSLFGGGTDYPEWFSTHNGAVLVSTVDKYSYVSLRKLPPFFQYKSRVVWSKVEMVENALDIEHPGIRGVLAYLNDLQSGYEIHYDGDLPARAGMGSSSSFIVGLLNAYWSLSNTREADPEMLARTAITVERKYVGDTVGVQDQIAAAFGGLNLVSLFNGNEFIREPVSALSAAKLERGLALVFTGFTRHAAELASAQVAEIHEHERALSRMAAQAYEANELLQATAPAQDFDFKAFFEMLNEAWELKRSLSPLISNPGIEAARADMFSYGAKAVKLIGAGGGGFFLVACWPEARERVMQYCRANGWISFPVHFSYTGSRVIFNDEHRQR